ncbi:Coiled-coil domain-containing protein 63, partial [Tetrabaena socialis]
DATGIEDIDQLVNTFLAAEDQNYTLFNYVNEVNQEIEKLEDQINVMRSEINKYRETGQELDRTKSRELSEGDARLAGCEAQSQMYEKRYESAMGMTAVLRQGISELFERIGCNTPAVRDLLGEEGLTEANLVAYLGIIEQRTNEILQVYARRKAVLGTEGLTEALQAQPLTQPGNRIVIEPPSTTQEEEMDGLEPEMVEEDRPLTREALESKVARTLPRKLETAIKVRPAGADATGGKRGSPTRR